MNKRYYDQIGHKMVSSFKQQWPSDINLRIYHEDSLTIEQSDNIELIDLYEAEPQCKAFVERHKNRPDQQNPLELHMGAVRFAYKTFSIINAATTSLADYLIWIDADTFTHTPVTHEFLNSLVDRSKYLTYLGRKNNYSECGFVIYNLNHAGNIPFMDVWRHLYEDDEVFQLDQWHDSFVFDRIRETYEKQGVIENNNLSPWGRDYDHVFINSIIGDYMDHMKGPRKNSGKSKKSDLIRNKTGEYWNNL